MVFRTLRLHGEDIKLAIAIIAILAIPDFLEKTVVMLFIVLSLKAIILLEVVLIRVVSLKFSFRVKITVPLV